jgi:hypothetical protein
VQAVYREGGHSYNNYKFFLLCGINADLQIEDGEWMGYFINETVHWPFILKNGKSCFYGGEEHSYEPTNIGSSSINVGRLFTISSSPSEITPWEATYEITSCHVYRD